MLTQERVPPLPSHRLMHCSPWLASACATAVILLGTIVLYAWYADISIDLYPGFVSTKANTAAGLIAAGFSLLLLLMRAAGLLPAVLGRLLALSILALGAATATQDAFGLDFGIDQILFPQHPSPFSGPPGRMAPLSALCFVLAGACLLFIDYRTRRQNYPAEYGAFLLAGVAAIPLVGFVYGALPLTRIGSTAEVAVATSLGFVVVAAGIFFARPEHRLMDIWWSASPGGQLLRGMLPKGLLTLVVTIWAVQWLATRDAMNREMAGALATAATVGVLMILCWRAAVRINHEHAGRLQSAAALAENAGLLRAVSDTTEDCIFVKDRDGRMIYANPATARLLGTDTASLTGRTSRDLLSNSADAAAIDANDQRVMNSGQSEGFEETVLFPGGLRTLYSTKAPLRDNAGKIVGLVGIATDISERKLLEDQLRAHEVELERLVRMRTAQVRELVGHLQIAREEEKRAIARELHDDLGSSLTALGMHLAILAQDIPLDSGTRRHASKAQELVKEITGTTRRLQTQLRPSDIDVLGIKAALRELVAEFSTYAGIDGNADLPDEDVAYSPALEIALYRIVQEALNNAAKHSGAKSVRVVLDDTVEQVTLTIRDDGSGISATAEENLSTHGLRGIRERAAYLGGSLEISATQSGGAILTVTLPKPSNNGPSALAQVTH